jgi:hypothetical protein
MTLGTALLDPSEEESGTEAIIEGTQQEFPKYQTRGTSRTNSTTTTQSERNTCCEKQ